MVDYNDKEKKLAPVIDPLDSNATRQLAEGMAAYAGIKAKKENTTLDEAITLLREKDARDSFRKSTNAICNTWQRIGRPNYSEVPSDLQGWDYFGTPEEELRMYIFGLKFEEERKKRQKQKDFEEAVEFIVAEERSD
jgi:hypothetical protein